MLHVTDTSLANELPVIGGIANRTATTCVTSAVTERSSSHDRARPFAVVDRHVWGLHIEPQIEAIKLDEWNDH
jgi:hypothetical protein